MSVDFSKFDALINEEEIAKEIEKASENDYDEVPKGRYIATIEKMEIKPTKAGDKLMFSVSMKIKETITAANKQDNRWVFFNRVISGNKPNEKGTWNDGVAIKGVMKWLDKLDTSILLSFKNYSDFAVLVTDIYQEVSGAVEIEIDYDPEAFNPITIREVYDL